MPQPALARDGARTTTVSNKRPGGVNGWGPRWEPRRRAMKALSVAMSLAVVLLAAGCGKLKVVEADKLLERGKEIAGV